MDVLSDIYRLPTPVTQVIGILRPTSDSISSLAIMFEGYSSAAIALLSPDSLLAYAPPLPSAKY